jgi:hypothetical protein
MVIEAETVKAASEVGARIVFTVYAPDKLRKALRTVKAGSKPARK